MNAMRCATLALLVGLVLVLSGCKTSNPNVTNTAGEYSTLVQAAPPAATAAAKAAVEDLKLIVISSESTDLDGKVVARTATDTRVNITVKRAGENISEVAVRVGTLGDKAVSMQIIEKMKARL